MRNYLSAECYKVFHRSYFYLTLLVCLALEGLLLWGSWLTYHWGNGAIDFYSTALMIPVLLSVVCTPLCWPPIWSFPTRISTTP